MFRILLLLLPFTVSCNTVRTITSKAEEEHNALYRQKVLLVSEVTDHRIYLYNPIGTRCYYLHEKVAARKWQTGDTMVIDSNLTDFYHLRYLKKCRQERLLSKPR